MPGVATDQLRQLIAAILHLQAHWNTFSSEQGGPAGETGKKIESMLAVERCLKGLQLVAAAERLLKPALHGGQGACGGR